MTPSNNIDIIIGREILRFPQTINKSGVGRFIVYDLSNQFAPASSTIPLQTGNAGKILTTNGTLLSWANILTILGFTPINKAGDTMLGNLILNANATNPLGAVTLQQANALVTGLWDDRGNYNASVNLFPSTGGSGTGGAILKGDIWTISVPGTLGGVAVSNGYTVRALVDSPAQIAGNWALGQQGLGYTPLTNTLASAKIFVGSAGNIAVAVSLSGDGTINNLGVFTLNTVAIAKGGTGNTAYTAKKILLYDGTKFVSAAYLSEDLSRTIKSFLVRATGTDQTRIMGRANASGGAAEIVTFGGTDSGDTFGAYLKFNFNTALITFGSDSVPNAVTIDMNSGILSGYINATTLDVPGVATFYDLGLQQFLGSVLIYLNLTVQGTVTFGVLSLTGVSGQPAINIQASGRSLITTSVAGSLEFDDATNSVYYTSGDNVRRRLKYQEPVGLTQSSAPSHTPQSQWDYYDGTNLTTNITINNPSFTPKNFQPYKIRLKSALARTITWGTAYVQMGVALPITTVAGKTTTIYLEWNTTLAKFGCVDVKTEL